MKLTTNTPSGRYSKLQLFKIQVGACIVAPTCYQWIRSTSTSNHPCIVLRSENQLSPDIISSIQHSGGSLAHPLHAKRNINIQRVHHHQNIFPHTRWCTFQENNEPWLYHHCRIPKHRCLCASVVSNIFWKPVCSFGYMLVHQRWSHRQDKDNHTGHIRMCGFFYHPSAARVLSSMARRFWRRPFPSSTFVKLYTRINTGFRR